MILILARLNKRVRIKDGIPAGGQTRVFGHRRAGILRRASRIGQKSPRRGADTDRFTPERRFHAIAQQVLTALYLTAMGMRWMLDPDAKMRDAMMTEQSVTGTLNRDRSAKLILRKLEVAKATIGSNPEATRRHLDTIIDLLSQQVANEESGRSLAVPTRPALSSWQAKRIRTFIEDNLERAIPIQELAGIARLSVGHFFRAFRGTFGIAPHSYIVTRRIERAERRLCDSGSSLAEVALDCGFSDQAHFSRAFAKHAGLPPGAWRRMQLLPGRDDWEQST